MADGAQRCFGGYPGCQSVVDDDHVAIGQRGECSITSVPAHAPVDFCLDAVDKGVEAFVVKPHTGRVCREHRRIEALSHRTDPVLGLPGCAHLSGNEHIKWRADGHGDLPCDGHSTARQCQDDRIRKLKTAEELDELPSGVSAVAESHDEPDQRLLSERVRRRW